MPKVPPHLHIWLSPVKHEDKVNYLIKCSLCSASVKITAKQFLKGGYGK